MAVCRQVGIRFMGTGGIGGVHRGFAETLDISSDLLQLARTEAMVVSSGPKSSMPGISVTPIMCHSCRDVAVG